MWYVTAFGGGRCVSAIPFTIASMSASLPCDMQQLSRLLCA